MIIDNLINYDFDLRVIFIRKAMSQTSDTYYTALIHSKTSYSNWYNVDRKFFKQSLYKHDSV